MSHEIDIRQVACPTCEKPAGEPCGITPGRGPYNHKTRADLAMATVLRGALVARGQELTEDQQLRIERLAPKLVDAGLQPRPLTGKK